MFYHISALALISVVLALAAFRRSSLYSPLVISASVWLVVFIAGVILQNRFYPVQETAYIAWLIWFMITSMIFFFLCPSGVKRVWTETEIRKIPVDYTFILILLILWLGYRIWVIGSTGPEHFFLNLRLSSNQVEGFTPMGLLGRFYPLIFALFLFEHVYARPENRHLRFMLWCWMLLYAVATMGKLALLTPILSWAIIQGITGRLNVRWIAVLAPIVFASMISLHLIRAGSPDGSSIEDILAIYIYSPFVALGYMDIDGSLPVGAYVFRFFYAVGYLLGVAPQPVNVITPYVEVPELTNVYTIVHPFYHDFAMLGVLLGAVFYGLFFSCLYWLSAKGSGLGLVLFSGYSIVLLMQFFGDLLVMMFSGNLQLLICVVAIFLVSRRIRHVH